MAPKLTVDESLLFMYTCFKHKSGDNCDFTAVGAHFGNLKPGAARKRFYRLRDAIEGKKIGSGEVGKASHEGNNGIVKASPAKGKAKRKRSAAGPPSKKRKAAEVESEVEDDEEVHGPVKKEESEEDGGLEC